MWPAISATDLSHWADRREAQSQLPVLIRRLIHCTCSDLTVITFPGGDSVQIGGFDGALETSKGNVWAPAGKSIWEMGCDRKIKQKADGDYRKRTTTVVVEERRQSTFVFVTPRRWSGKAAWVASRKAEDQWADIRCLDADDLEQWIEVSPITAAWLTRVLGRVVEGILTAIDYWRKWSCAAKPELPAELLLAGRDELVSKLVDLIEKRPSQAITVAADSRHEALAFVCAALSTQPKLSDRLLVVEGKFRPDQLGKPEGQILALSDAAAEEQFAHLSSQIPLIVPLARGQVGGAPDIDLEPISGEHFEKCLEQLGLTDHEIMVAERESGRSITVLRRRWAVTPALAQPKWSGDSEIAGKLVPFALCGAWHLGRNGDLGTLAAIANLSLEQIEQNSNELLSLDDAPIEAIGRYNRVVSQIDALFAIGPRLTKLDFDRFFSVIERAIGVRDPALDLPEEKRWMANILGKEHPFSGALLKGIGNALILLAIHGNTICGRRLGIDIQGRISALVSRLLTDLTGEQWVSIRVNLRLLAEAAPDSFLSALERDLAKAQPAVMALMPVTKGGVTDQCLRVELLWALELLAWNPRTYGRVVGILAILSRVHLDDNWVNKPANSLHSLFRTWLPKTAAPIEMRVETLRQLFNVEPEVAFDLAISLVDTRHAIATDNTRPRWRNDAANAGRRASAIEYYDMAIAAAELLLTRASYYLEHLQKIVPVAACFVADHQTRLWNIVRSWALTAADGDKAALKETLRKYIARRRKKHDVKEVEDVFSSLEPSNLCERHKWLFEGHWLDLSADELDEDENYSDRQERVDGRRFQALLEILAVEGEAGIFRFALGVKEPALVAYFIAKKLTEVIPQESIVGFMDNAVSSNQLALFRRGYFAALEDQELAALLRLYVGQCARRNISDEMFIDILCQAPTGRVVWSLVDEQPEELRGKYWAKVNIGWFDWTAEDVEVVIRNLLAVGRPRSAFFAIRLDKQLVSAESMQMVLHSLLTIDEPGVSVPVAYDIADAFKILDRSPAPDQAAMAKLEFAFSMALVDTERGMPNLSRHFVEEPAEYVRMLSYVYPRTDDGNDPEGWKIADEKHEANIAETCSCVIEHWNVVKVFTHNDVLDVVAFKEWIDKCRAIASEVARGRIADFKIGTMLAWNAFRGEEVWPSPAVCDVLEHIGTDSMRDAFSSGVFNSRGMTTRDPFEGGQQERGVAKRFDDYAAVLEIKWPKLAATIRDLADGYRRDAESHDRQARLNQVRDL